LAQVWPPIHSQRHQRTAARAIFGFRLADGNLGRGACLYCRRGKSLMTRSTAGHPDDPENAWITMMTTDNYVDGVIVLAYSLLRAGSKYRLLVMLTPTVTDGARTRLARLDNCQLVDVNAITPPPGKTNYAFPYFGESWTKLTIWKFEQYRRLVWLDADMLAVRNMDELFDIEVDPKSIAAVPQCACNGMRFESFPAYFKPENCIYHGLPGHLRLFNAGLLVITPSTRLYDEFVNALHELDLSRQHFAEQDMLNGYFADRWHALDYSYNATIGISRAHPEIWSLDTVKNIHYAGEKPWHRDMETAEAQQSPIFHLNKIWWDIRQEAFARIYPNRAAEGRATYRETVPS
jgi:lipopolysaccharide biosynthesis glycosyltransferase